jgi:peptidoglycan hydrolase CwlO-like protein
MPTVTEEIIEAAIDGLEAKKQRIDNQIAELRAMMDGAPAATSTRGGPRKFSAAARQKMRAAQLRRWAKVKGESATAQKSKPRPKRKMSAAGRKAISRAMKKRWQAKRADKTAT